MNTKELLKELETIIEELGIELCYERNIHGNGGFCVLKGRKIIILKNSLDTLERVEKLLEILREQDLDSIYVPPVIRGLIEKN